MCSTAGGQAVFLPLCPVVVVVHVPSLISSVSLLLYFSTLGCFFAFLRIHYTFYFLCFIAAIFLYETWFFWRPWVMIYLFPTFFCETLEHTKQNYAFRVEIKIVFVLACRLIWSTVSFPKSLILFFTSDGATHISSLVSLPGRSMALCVLILTHEAPFNVCMRHTELSNKCKYQINTM